MKKLKSQTKPADPHAAEPPTTEQLAMIAATLARSSNERADMLTYDAMELWLSAQKRKVNHCSYWESYGEMGVNSPTHEDLAMLAVNLARNINDEPKKLVNAAFEIWIEAGFKVESDYFDGCLGVMKAQENTIFTIADYDKGRSVIPRDKFFKKILPPSKRSRSYDLAKLGKAFVRFLFRVQFDREPSEGEFHDFYKKWNAGNLDQAHDLAWNFMTWHKQQIREARRAAGKISAFKKKLKKRL
jgi:hypothetical protein